MSSPRCRRSVVSVNQQEHSSPLLPSTHASPTNGSPNGDEYDHDKSKRRRSLHRLWRTSRRSLTVLSRYYSSAFSFVQSKDPRYRASFYLACAFTVLLVQSLLHSPRTSFQHWRIRRQRDVSVVFSTWKTLSSDHAFYSIPSTPPLVVPIEPDFGDLEIYTLKYTADIHFVRKVVPDEEQWLEDDRRHFLREIDDPDMSSKYYHSDELDYPRDCDRTNWSWRTYPVCNNFHEFSLNPMDNNRDVNITWLSHGYYRDSWLWDPFDDASENYVLKTLRFIEDHDVDYYSMRKIGKEAITMERLTASPRIVDIYGHCATSIRAETMPGEITEAIVPGDVHDYDRGHIGQDELDQWQRLDVHPLNNFTVTEKLDMSLLMAESLADLHGFEGGVIVHGDAHPDQWLVAKDGRLKLNDFNNGHMLSYNRDEDEYCPYWSSFGGAYKAPEEFRGDDCDEGVDVWAIGHGIFGFLTGLFPFYDEPSHSHIRELVKQGKKPFVDSRYKTRSFIEGRLVEIMEQCWEYDIGERVDIFEVVRHLRETKRMYEADPERGADEEDGQQQQEEVEEAEEEATPEGLTEHEGITGGDDEAETLRQE